MIRKLSLCLLTLSIMTFGSVAFAQSNDDASQASDNTSEGLTISPPVVEINLEPGNSYEKTVKITNPTDSLVELYPVAMNFGAKDESGTPTFLSAEDDSYTFSMANWIKFDTEKVALTSQQVVDFEYTIEVPADVEPGGHYGVLFFSTKAPELATDQSQVAISSQVGVLILGKVSGDIKEEGSVEEFSAVKSFYLKAPVDLTARIKNSGNVHFKPNGDVTIKNIFGSEVGKITFNESSGNVLPDSIRKFDIQWNPNQSPFYKIPIGKFTASLAATYGENNQSLASDVSFWIIPIWFMIVVGIVILLIIFLIIWTKKGQNKQVAEALSNNKDDNEEDIKVEDYSQENADKKEK